MKRGRVLGYEGRFRLLEPGISNTFDLAFMSRAALGSHWKEISETDREQLIRAFTRMTVANYASQFAGWGGERFEVGESVDGGQGTTVVRTRIVEGDGRSTTGCARGRPAGGWSMSSSRAA
jgi:phospholipid transport system substrate-binding protein